MPGGAHVDKVRLLAGPAARGTAAGGLRAGLRQPRLQRRPALPCLRVCARCGRPLDRIPLPVHGQGRHVRLQRRRRPQPRGRLPAHLRGRRRRGARGLGQHHRRRRGQSEVLPRHHRSGNHRVPGGQRLPALQPGGLYLDGLQKWLQGRQPRGPGRGLRHGRGQRPAVLDDQEQLGLQFRRGGLLQDRGLQEYVRRRRLHGLPRLVRRGRSGGHAHRGVMGGLVRVLFPRGVCARRARTRHVPALCRYSRYVFRSACVAQQPLTLAACGLQGKRSSSP
mmetsp:Transcript_63203/g.164231  ORF Transcript_63203/g.164231 Transcript_63203/m.164231 type:complete len:278 (-) Transcript_63203:1-834(-)